MSAVALQERAAHRHVDDDEDGASTVRPYAVTGGRTRVSLADLPMEALVEGLVQPDVQLTSERRRILELTATQYLSVAELSAHLRLPLGVVRVLVNDLASVQKVRVHGLAGPAPVGSGSSRESAAATLRVLEGVLDGISAL